MTWITDYDDTGSTIDFTIETNSEGNLRIATLTVSYPGAEDVSLIVVQEIQYDYNHTLEDFLGYFYPGEGYNGEALYYICLSDLGFENDNYIINGHYYNFALLVNEASGRTLPTGIYYYTEDYSGDYVFSSYYSGYIYYGNSEYYLVGGTLVVSAEGDTYTIQGMVTDYNGEVHRIYYTGSAEVKSWTLEDLEYEATTAASYCWSSLKGVMDVDVIFTTMTYDGYNFTPPGIYMTLQVFLPYDADGKIAEGTYEVNTTSESMTIYPYDNSSIYNYETNDWYDDYTYGTIASGSMTVTETGDDTYYIVCNFVTDGGATVKCTYSGSLVVENVPDPTSSLTDNYQLDLTNITNAMAEYYGDYYSNGGTNWYVLLSPSGAGDALIIDINAASGDFGDGIPSGTYTASSTTTPKVGEYAYGYLYWGSYIGTWYVQYDSSGDFAQQAPAIKGDITVTNNGSNNYTIQFACTDDAGYVWSGEWTGTLSLVNSSSYSVSSTSLGKSSAFSKLSKQEMIAKSAEMRAAQREHRMKVSVPAEESRTFKPKK